MKLDTNRTASQIEMWSINRLRPYDKNPKLHPVEQIDSICRSIKTFGWTTPVLVHTVFGIIAGHGRYMAALKLGIEEVPVIILDHLTVNEAKAYLLRDNKEGDTGYDNDLLASVLLDLENANVDLEITGFSDLEISKLLNPEPDDETSRDQGLGKGKVINSIECSIGEYEFTLDLQIYNGAIARIMKESGKTNDAVIRELIDRICR